LEESTEQLRGLRTLLLMPELPEVETVVRSLRPLLIGRKIMDVELPTSAGRAAGNGKADPILHRLLATPAEEFRSRLRGARVESIRRHGKNLLIAVHKEDQRPQATCLLVHLGMTGRLLFEAMPEPARPHTHLIFNLDAPGLWLHFSDPRRFGKLRLITDQNSDAIGELGPDPLEISAAAFCDRLQRRQAMVKSLLLDQRFLRGLGNIYADESLFRAGIHPAAIGAHLSRPRATRLYEAIRETLTQAIELGGSSISSYMDAQGRRGWFQQVHQVYQRTGEKCFRCGARVCRMVIAGRSTHFCPHCQPRGKKTGGRKTGGERRLAAASPSRKKAG
jgi:formamidopyrimidine-DNA glycosylase